MTRAELRLKLLELNHRPDQPPDFTIERAKIMEKWVDIEDAKRPAPAPPKAQFKKSDNADIF